MNDLARITTKVLDDVAVVSVSGEIDLSNAAQTMETVRRAAADAAGLALDLSEVAFMDSAAVRHLFALARETGGKACLVIAPGSIVSRLATVTALSNAMPIFDSVEQALSARDPS